MVIVWWEFVLQQIGAFELLVDGTGGCEELLENLLLGAQARQRHIESEAAYHVTTTPQRRCKADNAIRIDIRCYW